MKRRLRFTPEAAEDLRELFEVLAVRDYAAARRARASLEKAFEHLRLFPASCRKADPGGSRPFLREMVVGFGRSGYVILFEIDDAVHVTVLAVRHQREDDYH